MTHEELRERLSAYVDGELDAGQRAELAAHLEECDGCRGELAALRAVDEAVANQPLPDPGPAYWERFADRVTERLQPRPDDEPARLYERLTGWLFPRGRFAWARAAVALASCTLLVTVGLHGFRTVEVAVRPPAADLESGPPGSPPRLAEPARPLPDEPAEAAPRAGDTASKSAAGSSQATGPARATAPRDRRSPPEASAAPRPTQPGAAVRPPESEPAVGGPVAVPPPIDAPQTMQASPFVSKDSAGATRLQREPAAAMQALRSGELPPPVPGPLPAVGKSLERRSSVPSAAKIETLQLAAPSAAEVDSLLARHARLWPLREEPERRPQLEELARELTAHADDARARTRASELLQYLAATSPDAAAAERWRVLLQALPEP